MTGSPLEVATTLIAFSYLLPLMSFVALYLMRSNWASTNLGMLILLQKVGFSLIMIMAILSIFVPHYTGELILRFAVYAGVAALLWIDVYRLVKYQSEPFVPPAIPTVRWWQRETPVVRWWRRKIKP